MCTFRPVRLDGDVVPQIMSAENAETFCAMVNYFIATSYLCKYGDIVLGEFPKK